MQQSNKTHHTGDKILKKIKGHWVAVLCSLTLLGVAPLTNPVTAGADQIHDLVQVYNVSNSSSFADKESYQAMPLVQEESRKAVADLGNDWTLKTPEDIAQEIQQQQDLGLPVYVIQWGDTIPAIAEALGVETMDLAMWNGLQDASQIMTGDLLTLEDPAVVSSESVVAEAESNQLPETDSVELPEEGSASEVISEEDDDAYEDDTPDDTNNETEAVNEEDSSEDHFEEDDSDDEAPSEDEAESEIEDDITEETPAESENESENNNRDDDMPADEDSEDDDVTEDVPSEEDTPSEDNDPTDETTPTEPETEEPTPEEPETDNPISFDTNLVQELIFGLVNSHRANNGLPELVHASSLQAGAELRAQEMADYGDLRYIDENGNQHAHTRPDGSSWNTAFDNYEGRLGENIAQVSVSSDQDFLPENEVAQSLFTSWVNSDGHNAQMLDREYSSLAVGVAYGEDSLTSPGEMSNYIGVQIFSSGIEAADQSVAEETASVESVYEEPEITEEFMAEPEYEAMPAEETTTEIPVGEAF